MKRIISIVLILATRTVCALSLISCSDGDITKELKFELLSDDTYAVVGFDGDETDIKIPDTYEGKAVTVIGGNAFKESKLVKIEIPASVKKIEENAFWYSSQLETVVLSEGLESIGISAFWNCLKIKSMTIPSTVTKIGEFAFQNCSSLESVNIPSGVETVYTNTFKGCNLKTIVLDSAKFTSDDASAKLKIMFENAEVIYVKDSITVVGTVISTEFDLATSDKIGYNKYTKKTRE